MRTIPTLTLAAVTFVLPVLSGNLRAGQAKPASSVGDAASHGVTLGSMDKTCKPCEDFYHYASGEWLAKNPVPAAYPSWGRFNELAERNRELLHQILEGGGGKYQGDSRLE